MRTYSSPEPTAVAEVNQVDLDELTEEIYGLHNGSFFPAVFSPSLLPDLNERLGLEDLPIKPRVFRLLKQSSLAAARWHYDGGLGLLDRESFPDIATFSTSYPTEVIVGDLPIVEYGWGTSGPEDILLLRRPSRSVQQNRGS